MTKEELTEYSWNLIQKRDGGLAWTVEKFKEQWAKSGARGDWAEVEPVVSHIFEAGWKNGFFQCLCSVERGVQPVVQGEN